MKFILSNNKFSNQATCPSLIRSSIRRIFFLKKEIGKITRVFVHEQRGQNASDQQRISSYCETMTALLNNLRDVVGITDADIVCHSLGSIFTVSILVLMGEAGWIRIHTEFSI